MKLVFLFFLLSPMSLISMENQEFFEQEPVSLLENIYADSPDRIRTIVSQLRGESAISRPDFRAVYFVGDTGTGKNATAKTIAYKAGWKLKRLLFIDFLIDEPFGIAIKLRDGLKAAADNQDPTLLVLDGFDELFKCGQLARQEAESTSSAFRTFLDSQSGKDNFFLIAILSNLESLPRCMKSRILSTTFKFPLITDPVKKREILRRAIEQTNMKLADECDDDFFDQCIIDLGNVSLRSYQNLSNVVDDLKEYKQVSVITPEIISEAVATILKDRQEMQIGKKQESESDQQDRIRREN